MKTQVIIIKEKYADNSYLVVDKNLDDLIQLSKKYHKKDMKNQILGFVASLSVRYKAIPLFCSNPEYASYIIARLCEKANDNKKVNVYHSKPRVKKSDKQIHLLCGLPMVEEEIAMRLLNKFGTPMAIFNATEKELLAVEGVGKKTVESIKEVLGE